MHNIRCDPDLGVSKAAVRIISCACMSCIEQLELPWDKIEKDYNQKRCNVNDNCFYWNIFECLNDWSILTLVTTSNTNTEKDDEEFETILRGVDTIISG